MSFSTDEINTGVPELLDRIDALERKEIAAVNEIRRLLLSRSEAIAARDNARARLESVEAARRDAQESRFALIIQNEELGAELADTRTRLEKAEAALREAVGLCIRCCGEGELSYDPETNQYYIPCPDCSHLRAALGAAGERSEG